MLGRSCQAMSNGASALARYNHLAARRRNGHDAAELRLQRGPGPLSPFRAPNVRRLLSRVTGWTKVQDGQQRTDSSAGRQEDNFEADRPIGHASRRLRFRQHGVIGAGEDRWERKASRSRPGCCDLAAPQFLTTWHRLQPWPLPPAAKPNQDNNALDVGTCIQEQVVRCSILTSVRTARQVSGRDTEMWGCVWRQSVATTPPESKLKTVPALLIPANQWQRLSASTRPLHTPTQQWRASTSTTRTTESSRAASRKRSLYWQWL